ncbi:MAG: hypothetical protein HYT76_09310 [Deltaproteobacteria bacterium]|nr:hypothetical protein [Deltaproteobacteria bacterium]
MKTKIVLLAALIPFFIGCNEKEVAQTFAEEETINEEEATDEVTEETSNGIDESKPIVSPGKNVEYIYVYPYDGNPETEWKIADITAWYGGQVVVADPDKNFPINWKDDETIPEDFDPKTIKTVKEEDGNPDSYDCILGGKPVANMDASWKGYENGGCGTWATAVCNRILGEAEGEVSQGEWNKIADGIKQNADGGASMSDQSKYYEDKGYCVTEKKFGGSEADYQEMEEEMDDECDVKLFVWKRQEDGSFVNGHVETVLSVDPESRSCTTNSWGVEADVQGGNDGGFSHSSDGETFQDSEGNKMWPEDATEVWVSYVCECSLLDSLGKLVGF